MSNLKQAQTAAEKGYPVFPVRASDAQPYTAHGFKDASLDPYLIEDWFTEKFPNALVAIHTGAAGILVMDIDVKRNDSGTIVTDGFESLVESGKDYGFTHVTTSRGGEGEHHWFLAPEGVELGPDSNCAGVVGVDRRAGGSYIALHPDAEIPDRDSLEPAPEWLCYEKKAREHVFSGTVEEWFDSLEPGEPDARVQAALSDIEKTFSDNGNDLSHNEITAAQHRAVRLGAEGASGVRSLLDRIEEMALTRTGEHSRTPDEWQAEYNESLESGIAKYGEALEIRKALPEYNLSLVPDTTPMSLVTGAPAGKSGVMRLVRALVNGGLSQAPAVSVVWSAPATRDTARSWGLEFVWTIVGDEIARKKNPDVPIPDRPTPDVAEEKSSVESLLSEEEREHAAEIPTFVDTYLNLSEESVGFRQPEYGVPLAWTVLSMACARQVVIPKSGGFGTNLWFAVLGYSGTGKSVAHGFAREVLNGFLTGDETYWSTGAGSPEGIEEALVRRDGKASMLFEDEAAAFYKNLLAKDWMKSLSNQMANWYMGTATAPQKVRLQELRGRQASISFNYFTISTPEDTLRVIDEEMFGTGFMARMAWVFGPPPVQGDERYRATRSDLTSHGRSRQAVVLGTEMAIFSLSTDTTAGRRTEVWGTAEAVSRLEQAYRDMDRKSRRKAKYDAVIQPSVVRLDETMWKIAALSAFYRGSDEFDLDDALVAIYYVEQWYRNLIRISDEIAGAYLRDVNQISAYVQKQGGSVARQGLVKAFGHLINRSRAELADRLDYAVESGILSVKQENGRTMYEVG